MPVPVEITPEVKRKVGFLLHILHPPAQFNDDLLQEGLIAYVKCCRSFDPRSGVQLWSYAHRRVYGAMQDYLRRNHAFGPWRRKHKVDPKAVNFEVAVSSKRDPGPLPDALALHGEIRRAARRLPVHLRTALADRLWNGKTFDEIARKHGISEAGAYVRYNRAIELLRQALAYT